MKTRVVMEDADLDGNTTSKQRVAVAVCSDAGQQSIMEVPITVATRIMDGIIELNNWRETQKRKRVDVRKGLRTGAHVVVSLCKSPGDMFPRYEVCVDKLQRLPRKTLAVCKGKIYDVEGVYVKLARS